ncbi:hypothetical protein [Streptomyces cadmiisoli]|uniref:hypothetical protein n=1 Tax=Streptomyces cadmiisoli TaxID=2184053 RepID=UPI003655EA87
MSDDRQPPTPGAEAAPGATGRGDAAAGATPSGAVTPGAVTPGGAAPSGALSAGTTPGGATPSGVTPGGATPAGTGSGSAASGSVWPGGSDGRDQWAPPKPSSPDAHPEVVLDSAEIPEVPQDRETAYGMTQDGTAVPLVSPDAAPEPGADRDADTVWRTPHDTTPHVPLDGRTAADPRRTDPWAPPANGATGGPGATLAWSGPDTPGLPSVHDQRTVTSLPSADGTAGQGPQGWAAPAAPSTGAPHQGWAAPGPTDGASGAPAAFPPPAQAGIPFGAGVPAPGDSAVPPPPIAPDGPGPMQYGYPGGYGYPGQGAYPGPHPQGAPGYYGWPGATQMPSNGLGTAGLVVGIVAAAGFCLWPVAIVLGILGIVFGAIGRAKANRGEATNPGQALAGIICGTAGLLLGIGFGILVTVT